MAELIVEPIQTAELESSGYIGQPEGNIDLTENNVQVNVAPYKYATPKIPIQEDVPAVNPSAEEQTIIPDIGYEGMKSVKVNPANLETKRVTPTTGEQTIIPQPPAIGFSQFTVEPVTPSIDPDIQPENIKQGIDILGVQGTLKPPTLITKQIAENGTYAAEDDNADGYSEVVVNVPFPSIKLADIHPEQATNLLDMYIENIANPDDSHILIIMCNEYERLTPQSNYALFFNVSQVITVNGIRAVNNTNAMLRPNGTIGQGIPNINFSNHNFHWNDTYAYLFPGYTYSIYLINLGNNLSMPQREYVDEAPQKAAAFDYLTGRIDDE